MSKSAIERNREFEPLTLRVEDCAAILDISRSAAYSLVKSAEEAGGVPFVVCRVGGSLRISKTSFYDYLHAVGLLRTA